MNNRQLIRQNFLNMREAEDVKTKRMQREIDNQNDETKLMAWEDRYRKRMMFYEKMKVTKLDMHIEFLFDMEN